MIIANLIAFILVLVGCFNWGLVGIFNWNLVEAIFGPGQNVGNVIVYVLVFAASLYLIFVSIYKSGLIQIKK
ncbi:MAG: DUF378 domain-containing protein [Clostridia bacterium]